MSYERCTEHGLMRCVMCAVKPTGVSTPAPVVAVSTPAPVLPAGFSPEDALDTPQARPHDPNAPSVAAAPDKQAVEAIERQRAIAVARGELNELQKESRDILVTAHTMPGAIINVDGDPAKARIVISVDPIVNAAQEYASAQDRVEKVSKSLRELKVQVETAEEVLMRASQDRDMKKQVLQKLVSL